MMIFEERMIMSKTMTKKVFRFLDLQRMTIIMMMMIEMLINVDDDDDGDNNDDRCYCTNRPFNLVPTDSSYTKAKDSSCDIHKIIIAQLKL